MKSYIKLGIGHQRDNSRPLLPIKTETGSLEHMKTNYIANNKVVDVPKQVNVIEEEEPIEIEKTPIEMIQEHKSFIDSTKEKIASHCRSILEDPEQGMKKLKELRTLLSHKDVKNSFILRKLIIVSLCEVFKDIIPSYKIRPWTDKEKEQNVIT
jgi:nucleolar complex protein 3